MSLHYVVSNASTALMKYKNVVNTFFIIIVITYFIVKHCPLILLSSFCIIIFSLNFTTSLRYYCNQIHIITSSESPLCKRAELPVSKRI